MWRHVCVCVCACVCVCVCVWRMRSTERLGHDKHREAAATREQGKSWAQAVELLHQRRNGEASSCRLCDRCDD